VLLAIERPAKKPIDRVFLTAIAKELEKRKEEKGMNIKASKLAGDRPMRHKTKIPKFQSWNEINRGFASHAPYAGIIQIR
jgi:hypothetical protein